MLQRKCELKEDKENTWFVQNDWRCSIEISCPVCEAKNFLSEEWVKKMSVCWRNFEMFLHFSELFCLFLEEEEEGELILWFWHLCCLKVSKLEFLLKSWSIESFEFLFEVVALRHYKELPDPTEYRLPTFQPHKERERESVWVSKKKQNFHKSTNANYWCMKKWKKMKSVVCFVETKEEENKYSIFFVEMFLMLQCFNTFQKCGNFDLIVMNGFLERTVSPTITNKQWRSRFNKKLNDFDVTLCCSDMQCSTTIIIDCRQEQSEKNEHSVANQRKKCARILWWMSAPCSSIVLSCSNLPWAARVSATFVCNSRAPSFDSFGNTPVAQSLVMWKMRLYRTEKKRREVEILPEFL